MANKQTAYNSQKLAKRKAYEATCAKLLPFSIVGIALSVAVILLFFVHWATIYNTSIGGNEVQISGFNTFFAAITGGYSKTDSLYGDMAVPFYYYAKSYCQASGIFTILAFIVSVLGLFLQVLATKLHSLHISVVFLNGLAFLLLLACFIVSLSMANSDILPIYCSGNTACSIRSYAILPALCALASCVLSVFNTIKYAEAEKILK